MHRRQLHLEVAALEDLPGRVLSECGPYAEIVAAEKVTVGGINGFLGRAHYEVTVVVPDAPRDGVHLLDRPARAGIAALLDDADEREGLIHRETASPAAVSTASARFDDLIRSITFAEPAVPAKLRAPQLLKRPGDLVAFVGVWRDPLRVARSTAAATQASVCVAGSVIAPGAERVEDRRAAMDARAVGVRRGHGAHLALGLSGGRDGVAESAATLQSIAPDQVWAVVDAGRKPEDTAAWVEVLSRVVTIGGVAVLGRDTTSTPESVDELGLPVGWVDGAWVG